MFQSTCPTGQVSEHVNVEPCQQWCLPILALNGVWICPRVCSTISFSTATPTNRGLHSCHCAKQAPKTNLLIFITGTNIYSHYIDLIIVASNFKVVVDDLPTACVSYSVLMQTRANVIVIVLKQICSSTFIEDSCVSIFEIIALQSKI